MRYVPITGKPLNHEVFLTQFLVLNPDQKAFIILQEACRLQIEYKICDGDPAVFKNTMANVKQNKSTIENYTMIELDLSRKRKILTILVPKQLSNNE
tara:strand:- start:605 stop:895 length:291 start_codon:yes stop_codon:yes gene_type:complete